MEAVFTKERIPEIDVLRGSAAALMILGHSFIVYPIDISDVPWCAAIGHFIYTFHMELFFVLAGAVYHCRDYIPFLKKKAKRILTPYLFFGVLALLLRAFGGKSVNGVEPVGTGIFKLVFQGGGYWFLYTLFMMFTIYPWIEKILTKRWIKVFFFAAVLLAVQLQLFESALFNLSALAYYLPYFIIGIYVAKMIGGGQKYVLTRRQTVTVLTLSLISYVWIDAADLNGYAIGVLKYIRALAVMIILYLGIKTLLDKNPDNRVISVVMGFLKDCGAYSLQLYLFNGYLLTVFRILICQVFHISSSLWIVAGIWAGNLAVTLVACKWIIPQIPVLRDLCGIGK